MAPPRHAAIVVCSCGKRWGRSDRAAACEEMEAVEHALLATYVPLFARHWRLGHTLKLGDSAPREFLATIARAAEAVAGEREEAGDAAAVEGRRLLGPGD